MQISILVWPYGILNYFDISFWIIFGKLNNFICMNIELL